MVIKKTKSKTKIKTANKSNLSSRPPIVVVIGHVDHGKTTLLDYIKKTNLAAKEVGGITQKIGAYEVEIEKEGGKKARITFLDTPGHEAFSGMRKHGIKVADIAILVVAADDGVQPQTKEAIKFAQEASLPIIVALNKIDRPQADIAKTKSQLSEAGVLTEDWGGQTLSAEISAKSGQGVQELLETILLLTEMGEINANPDDRAAGIVLESKADPKKGILTTFLVKNGTLKLRDTVVSGVCIGKIKRMENFLGQSVQIAPPSAPVVAMGMENMPQPGQIFNAFKNPKDAKKAVLIARLALLESERTEKEEFAKNSELIAEEEKMAKGAETAEIKKEEKSAKPLNILLKADSKGTLEAIDSILSSLNFKEISLRVTKKSVGDINENDVREASIASTVIIGFNSRVPSSVSDLAKQKKVKIITGAIVYKLIEEVKALAASLLPPKIIKTTIGKLQVIAIFKTKKATGDGIEIVFGAKVLDGKIINGANIEIFHNKISAGVGKVLELQFNKEVSKEVSKPNNAGIHYRGNGKVEMNDIIEAYTEETIKQKLE
ncbi:translation initiation factor IF-2 [Patescibacteria group bacterium]|nr:translation initiation factor IF-2 [Patescibacteria group bacterium]MBU4580101.1 translation initiation factor IF-2 [Patescibacteria group bacterium]